MPKIQIGVGVAVAFAVLIWPDLPELGKWAGLLVGLGLVVWGIRDLRSGRVENPYRIPFWLPAWRISFEGPFKFEADSLFPVMRLVSLRDAMPKIYEKRKIQCPRKSLKNWMAVV